MSDQADSADKKREEKPPGLTAAEVMQFVRETFINRLVDVLLLTSYQSGSHRNVDPWNSNPLDCGSPRSSQRNIPMAGRD